MKTGLKFAALSLGLAVVLAGATGASADSRWNADHGQRGRIESRMDRHHHGFAAERHHPRQDEGRFGRQGGR